MKELLLSFKGLADPVRIRILQVLSHGEQCVCNLVEIFQLPQSTISRQLSVLKNANLINIRKEGLWHYYSLNKRPPMNESLYNFMSEQWSHDPVFASDNERIVQGLKCASPSPAKTD